METPLDWRKYPDFKPDEFRCRHTGKLRMDPAFLQLLQVLRAHYDDPIQISSGYRHPTHPAEAHKLHPGPHTTGRAADVRVRGSEAYRLLSLAVVLGFTGIGINQKGSARFLHLDTVPDSIQAPRPFVWSY